MAKIVGVDPNSPAAKAGIKPGEELLSINGHKIRDVLDFDFYGYDSALSVELQNGDARRTVRVRKPEGSELGLEFETYLMDKQRGCSNRCVFCFIDQLPRGMRKSLYFKDDDARLSFLLGNYISMTNLSDEDAERMIKMRVSPLNVSVHTTNPALRTLMLGNPRGGESLKYLYAFCKAGLKVKAQIVACPGLNDGKELEKTLTDLSALYPQIESVAVVPVGITSFRDGLYPLTPVDKNAAAAMIKIIDNAREKNMKKHGCGIVCAADELYLRAGMPLPGVDYYEGFSQLENGVGLLTSFEDELDIELKFAEDLKVKEEPFYIACGVAAEEFMNMCLSKVQKRFPEVRGKVISVPNDFFGRTVDVTGLVCGSDLINRLKKEPKVSRVLIPDVMLRHGETVFLDDVSVEDVEKELQTKVIVNNVSGADFLSAVTGGENE
ncbi:MAG: DUF512 domain-containing protein [Clostridia bacterium]|nr:DUF512 domain-containing protein [Clostridia bacterium]